MWLSTSTTLGILAAHLLGNAFVDYHAPTSYMVGCKVSALHTTAAGPC